MNQTCIDLLPLSSFARCPSDSQNRECSGRGVSFIVRLIHLESPGLSFQICSNINSCKCHDGFMGDDCSQIAPPTFAPPMYPRTPYPGAQGQPTTEEPDPDDVKPNVHIRKFFTGSQFESCTDWQKEKASRKSAVYNINDVGWKLEEIVKFHL